MINQTAIFKLFKTHEYMNTTIFIILGIVLFSIPFILRAFQKKKRKDRLYYLQHGDYETSAFESSLLMFLNHEREKLKRHILLVDFHTDRLALQRILEMMESEVIRHKESVDEMGELISMGADDVAENLAYGFSTASSTFNAFLKSEKHRETMLSENFDWCGISVRKDKKGKNVVCLLFGGDDLIN